MFPGAVFFVYIIVELVNITVTHIKINKKYLIIYLLLYVLFRYYPLLSSPLFPLTPPPSLSSLRPLRLHSRDVSYADVTYTSRTHTTSFHGRPCALLVIVLLFFISVFCIVLFYSCLSAHCLDIFYVTLNVKILDVIQLLAVIY